MEEPSKNVAPDPLHRAGAMKSAAKLLITVVLGLGFIASTFLSSKNENRDNVHHLRPRSPLERSLEDAALPECELDCCIQYEEELCASENGWIAAIPFALQIILIIVLISLSALFSGLTLGLMSLDKTGLQIVMGGDDPTAAAYAKAIYPIREDGNLLLCTLLLGNVAVNALLSILLAEYAGGIVGLFSSTFLIVIFGEILPQAFVSTCSCFMSIGDTLCRPSYPDMSSHTVLYVAAVFPICTKNRKLDTSRSQGDSFWFLSRG
jgi:hypothetical protein